MDLYSYAEANQENTYIFAKEEAAGPEGCADILGKFLIKAKQFQQGWLLLGKDGVIAPNDFTEDTQILGFGVTIGVAPIDGNCKPIGKAKPFQFSDLVNLNAVSQSLSTIFKGASNKRCRAITFWVIDKGIGQTQSTNQPGKELWENFMRVGSKSPPTKLLEHCQMVEPHQLALVYEFEQSPMEKTWHFKPNGDEVQTHLKASGLWAPLGLK